MEDEERNAAAARACYAKHAPSQPFYPDTVKQAQALFDVLPLP